MSDDNEKRGLKEELEGAAESLESAADKAWEIAQTSVLDRPPEEDKEARTWGMIAHISPLVVSWIGPLVVYLIKKDEMPFAADQGKEALNFSITTFILYVAIVIAGFCSGGFGFLLAPVLGVVTLVLHILAAIAANEGKWYRYPVNIRLIT